MLAVTSLHLDPKKYVFDTSNRAIIRLIQPLNTESCPSVSEQFLVCDSSFIANLFQTSDSYGVLTAMLVNFNDNSFTVKEFDVIDCTIH